MSSEVSARCEKLRQTFEGRDAILIEKGVVRVRVSNIEAKPVERSIAAEVQAIPTRGLPAGALYYHAAYQAGHPFRIGGGYLTSFSDHVWKMGYGGWTLLFAPRIVEGVVQLAARLPNDLDPFARYDEIARWLAEQHTFTDLTQDVFPKGNKNWDRQLLRDEGATPERFPYRQRHLARIESCLDWLEERATADGFVPGWFSIMDINLICPIMYAEKRRIARLRGRPRLEGIVTRFVGRPSVVSTPVSEAGGRTIRQPDAEEK